MNKLLLSSTSPASPFNELNAYDSISEAEKPLYNPPGGNDSSDGEKFENFYLNITLPSGLGKETRSLPIDDLPAPGDDQLPGPDLITRAVSLDTGISQQKKLKEFGLPSVRHASIEILIEELRSFLYRSSLRVKGTRIRSRSRAPTTVYKIFVTPSDPGLEDDSETDEEEREQLDRETSDGWIAMESRERGLPS